MSQAVKDAIFLNIPFLASLCLSAILSYYYYKERNKRKLMFAIGIFLGAFGYQAALAKNLGTTLLTSAGWLFVPMSSAIPIAVLSSFYKLDFEKPFRIFLLGTAASIAVFFAQIHAETFRLTLMIFFTAVSIPALTYLFAKNRDGSNLSFLLSTLCFMFQDITLEAGSQVEIPVLLSLFGILFTGLIFTLPSSGGPMSIVSFLKMEKQLDKTKEELKKTQEKLLKAERLAAIGELAGMIGHDLRNPLQGIAGAAYYLRAREASRLDKKGCEMVETIETCIQRSNKIINDLLEYSKEIHLDLQRVNPKALMENALTQIEIPSYIKIDDQTSENPSFTVDREKIERVFINIFLNAFDAMPNGGKLTLKSDSANGKVAFSFQDTGTGITSEVMSKLWTPLFTTKAKGMGFGLAICKRIVEAHEGEIKVESELGVGSVFTVVFPLKMKNQPDEESFILNTPELMQKVNALTQARMRLN